MQIHTKIQDRYINIRVVREYGKLVPIVNLPLINCPPHLKVNVESNRNNGPNSDLSYHNGGMG